MVIFSREQVKSECDWVVMVTSVLVVSQSCCFLLCSREQIRLMENRPNSRNIPVFEKHNVTVYGILSIHSHNNGNLHF
jgi:hypothetical protein